MALLELLASLNEEGLTLDHLTSMINKQLSERGSQFLGQGEFYKGVFLEKNGSWRKILGYDSAVSVVIDFDVSKLATKINLSRPREVSLSSGVTLIDASHAVSRGPNGEYIFSIDANKPLQLEIIEGSYQLQAQPTEQDLGKIFHNSQGIIEVVTGLGIPDQSQLPLHQRLRFPQERLQLLLDWIAENVEYGKPCKQNLRGWCYADANLVCEETSDLLSKMVFVAGGLAQNVGTSTLNLPFKGYNYFNRSNNLFSYNGHAITTVFNKDRWQVVDPTTYSSTIYNEELGLSLNERRELAKRSFSKEARNYQTTSISLPSLTIPLNPSDPCYNERRKEMQESDFLYQFGEGMPKNTHIISLSSSPHPQNRTIEIVK